MKYRLIGRKNPLKKKPQKTDTAAGKTKAGKSSASFAVKLILLLCCCTGGISREAFAIDGSTFTDARLIRDITWDQAAGRIVFRVMFYDNWDKGRDEYLGNADIYIGGTKVGRLYNSCSNDGSPTTDEWNYANLKFECYSGILGTYARGSIPATSACNDATHKDAYRYTYTDYSLNAGQSGMYTYTTGVYYEESRYAYDWVYYTPGEIWSDYTVSVELKNIYIDEENGGWKRPGFNVSRSVNITRSAKTVNITGGNIGTDGKVSVTCSVTEPITYIHFLINGQSVEYRYASSATFDTYFYEYDPYYGKNFSYIAAHYVDPGKTTYVYSSHQLSSQRTGIFNGDLKASLEKCGNVKLTWQISNPPTTDNINTDPFYIQRKKGSGNWEDVGSVEYRTVYGGTTDYSYTYQIPEEEMHAGTKYRFRVKRGFCTWDGPLKSTCQRDLASDIIADYKLLDKTSIRIEEGTDSYPRLSWKLSTDGVECLDNISLKLQVAGVAVAEIPKSSIITDATTLAGSYQTSVADNLQSCTPQSYELVLQYGNKPSVAYLVSNNYIVDVGGKREFEKIVVSKGYYADRNNIKWYLKQGAADFTRFRVMRREADAPDSEYAGIADIVHSSGILQYSYDDREINAGVYYSYKIEGIYECASSSGSMPSSVSVGFSQPYGSVSGRVTYTGSQAVRDVEIKVATDSELSSNRELEFNPERSGSFIIIPAGTRLFNREGFSVEFWLKFLNPSGEQLLLNNNSFHLKRSADNEIAVMMDGRTVTFPLTVPVGEYVHLTFTAKKLSDDYKNYELTVYLNDSASSQTLATGSAAQTPETLVTYLGGNFFGYMDDVRIWDKVLTAEEVALNYGRVLSGKETDLAAYYKFDELDVAENALFDCSAQGTAFNGNHAEKYPGVARANVPASASHLSIKGVTDENGNYSIINCIPFTSEGTTYTLVPSLGIHQFDPNNRPLYFSPDSRVFNNIDFTDISSFPVSGQIVYAGSNYPVEGVQISIDGLVASKDGKVIETGADGIFTVDVPIGSHFISLSKQGHTFADGGRFPANPLEKYNFQTSLNGLTFYDNTTVRIMGKVAGGKPQSEKQLGFGLSKANIGKATVKLKTTNDVYRLNLTGSDSTVTNLIGGQESKTTFKHPAAGSEIEIETSPETGEFLAVLPPVPYTLTYVKTADFEDTFTDGDEQDFEYSKMTFDISPSMEQTVEYVDSAGTKHEFAYHDSLRITRYNDPFIAVTDMDNRDGALGDSIYVYTDNLTGQKDTVRLYSVTGGAVTYRLGVPVVSQKTLRYNWHVESYEEYVNRDGAEPATDRVPLAGSEISVSNAFAAEMIVLDSITYDELSRDNSETSLILDSTGSCNYSFNVSFPNLAGNHQLGAQLTLNQNGKLYTWETEAVLLGQIPSDGNNFVTKGPDNVDIVLNDPPGSNSYAYIEKGSSFTYKQTHNYSNSISESLETTIHCGSTVENAVGVGLFIINEIDAIADIGINAAFEQKWTRNSEIETTVSFNQRIATSSDPNYVGNVADVYIGRSTNLVFGMVNQLALYPETQRPSDVNAGGAVGDYSLFPKRILSADVQFGTAFQYTQTHILGTQIPNIKELRNQLIEPVSAGFDTANIFFGDSKIKYISYLPANDPGFGEPGN